MEQATIQDAPEGSGSPHRRSDGARRRFKLTPVRLLVLGYLCVIALGTILLILPVSSRPDGGASFMDALFTTVSASCVTGLIVQPTNTYWSGFGQAVILILIQMGGIGFMTVIFSLMRLGGKKIGLKERTYMQEAVSAPHVGGLLKLTGTILLGTLAFECIGAFILCFRFVPDFGWGKGIWMAVFTAVSAFCNAGFDLMAQPGNDYPSLTAYSSDPIVCIVVPLLILIGGLGFFVWHDIRRNKWHMRKYTLHTKIVLLASVVVVVVPFLLLLIALNDLPWGERILSSFFSAVTPRTAGFNVIPMTIDTRAVVILLTILLMFIGGASGSTAGGVKTNTVSVLVLSLLSAIRGKRSPQAFKRRLDDENVKNAAQFTTAYLLFAMLGILLLSFFEMGSGYKLTELVFEVFSAIGTVGLTLGITPGLTVGSQIVLCVLMFLGRAGCMTVLLSWHAPSAPTAELPLERVRIG